jgi:hypothetical protein
MWVSRKLQMKWLFILRYVWSRVASDGVLNNARLHSSRQPGPIPNGKVDLAVRKDTMFRMTTRAMTMRTQGLAAGSNDGRT